MKKSLKRATAFIGLAPDIDPASYDHSEEDKYGVGNGEYVLQCDKWYDTME